MAVLTYAESKLVTKGKVKILINDDEEQSPEVEAGTNYWQRYQIMEYFFLQPVVDKALVQCVPAR